MQLSPHTEKEDKLLRLIKAPVCRLGNMYVKNVDGIRRDNFWEIYAEIVGDRLIRPEEVKELERKVSDEMHEPIKIRAWTKVEMIAADQRYLTGGAFMDEQKDKVTLGRIEKNLRQVLEQGL